MRFMIFIKSSYFLVLYLWEFFEDQVEGPLRECLLTLARQPKELLSLVSLC